MSGSSLDGLDIAYCQFNKINGYWNGQIILAETYTYSELWVNRLRDLSTQNALTYLQTHTYFGHYCAELVSDFILKYELQNIDFIASHGHTIFHDPARNITGQIGDGASIAALTGIPTISDFRTLDVALGGEGAPLVPKGDIDLFSNYNYCLNLGGICNLTQKDGSHISAFDIAPCNQLLNYYAEKLGFSYDDKGKLARTGQVFEPLLDALNELPFYGLAAPKSLANNFSSSLIIPMVEYSKCGYIDALATLTEHIACQIARQLNPSIGATCLVSGGGAFNSFLIERMQYHTKVQFHLPESKIIQFKEAYIFAYLGLLRWLEQVNTLATVTGASKDSCGGAIYLPYVK
jgi:anhydro-N-acetylmuramic acid kinase